MASLKSLASRSSVTQLRSESPAALAPVAAQRRPVCCRCSPEVPASGLSRRAGLAALVGLPLIASIPAAQAILPTQDDEDEELINKAKSNRKSRVAQELTTEKTFAKENYNDTALTTVSRAVKKIAKSGDQLEKGDLKAVAANISDSWVAEFQKVANDLSRTDAAKSSYPAIFKEISSLGSAASSGNSQSAKKEFVDTVSAIQAWADQAGIASQIIGL
ncbi:hypothetical protein WJX74_006583 [Apatococcus lobatus]|uniref:Maintenance of Photosystem II under High light 2 C-terminal domain-containing protein n=1 Tax=Apatococcus lobatus TaxID=904363 RepID=A0AAW1S5Z4_9CHLO